MVSPDSTSKAAVSLPSSTSNGNVEEGAKVIPFMTPDGESKQSSTSATLKGPTSLGTFAAASSTEPASYPGELFTSTGSMHQSIELAEMTSDFSQLVSTSDLGTLTDSLKSSSEYKIVHTTADIDSDKSTSETPYLTPTSVSSIAPDMYTRIVPTESSELTSMSSGSKNSYYLSASGSDYNLEASISSSWPEFPLETRMDFISSVSTDTPGARSSTLPPNILATTDSSLDTQGQSGMNTSAIIGGLLGSMLLLLLIVMAGFMALLCRRQIVLNQKIKLSSNIMEQRIFEMHTRRPENPLPVNPSRILDDHINPGETTVHLYSLSLVLFFSMHS